MDHAKDAPAPDPTPKLTPSQHADRAIRQANELRDEILVLSKEHPDHAAPLRAIVPSLDWTIGRLQIFESALRKSENP